MIKNKITAGLIIALLFVITVIACFNVYPPNMINITNYDDFGKKISGVDNAIKEVVFEDYYKQADEIDVAVTKYLTEEKGYTAEETSYKTPSEFWGSSQEAENQAGTWEWTGNGEGETKTNEVTINMTPTPDEMKGLIVAYMLAINGTLEQYTIEQRSASEEMKQILANNPNYFEDMKNLAENFEAGDYKKAMEQFGSNIFSYDRDTSTWTNNVATGDVERKYEVKKTVECAKKEVKNGGCTLVKVPTNDEDGNPIIEEKYYKTVTEEITEIVQGAVGNITVPVKYNLYNYRQAEIQSIIQYYTEPTLNENECNLALNGRWENDACTFGYSVQDIWDRINDQNSLYFNTYVQQFNIDTSASWFMQDGMYGDLLTGVGGSVIYGAVVNSYSDWSYATYGKLTPGSIGYATIWGHIEANLRANGKYRSKNGGQCTEFVWGRVYDQNGLDLSFSSGSAMAREAASKYPDSFELSRSPAPGAVGSCLLFNHVFYVDAVSEEGVTVSEGNINFNGSLNIARFYSWSEWNATSLSKALYAVPKGA